MIIRADDCDRGKRRSCPPCRPARRPWLPCHRVQPGHRPGAELGRAVLRFLELCAAHAGQPGLEQAHADGHLHRGPGDVGRGHLRRGCSHRRRPRPLGDERWLTVGRAGLPGLVPSDDALDVVRRVGAAGPGHGHDAVRAGLHRADQALPHALPRRHHRAHAGGGLCQHAEFSGRGLAAAPGAGLAPGAAGDWRAAAGRGRAARLGLAWPGAGGRPGGRGRTSRFHPAPGAAPRQLLAADAVLHPACLCAGRVVGACDTGLCFKTGDRA